MATEERPPEGWRAVPVVAVRTVRDALDDRLFGLGGEVAFFLLLSLPPALLAILGSMGYVSDALGEGVTGTIREQILEVGGSFLTPSARDEFLRPTVDSLLGEGRADVVSLGAVLAVWAASRATTRMIETVTITYDLEPRAGWRRRLIAVAITVVGMLVIVIVLPLLVAGPRLVASLSDPLGIGRGVAVAWRILYWPVVGLLGVGLLATFYHVATPWRTPWRRDFPGALLAAVLWLAGGAGLRVYASVALESSTYGPLAAPIVFLLWLYVTALAVLFGAELNAVIERTWPTRAKLKEDMAGPGPEKEAEEKPEERVPRGL